MSDLPDQRAEALDERLVEAMNAAVAEHATRAVSGLLADLDLVCRVRDAEATEQERRQWACCLFLRHLARNTTR